MFMFKQLIGAAIRLGLFVAVLPLAVIDSSSAESVHVVAPDRSYADLVETIAGAHVSISIVRPGSNSVTTLAQGSLVLCSGTHADAWLEGAASRVGPGVTLIKIYGPSQAQGGNVTFPWYDISAITAFSEAIARELARREPASASRISLNLARLLSDFKVIKDRIDKIRHDYAESEVIAADDLSREVARQLGFKVNGPMNHGRQTSVSPMDVLQHAVERREGSIFLYDKDGPNRSIQSIAAAATDSGLPVVALQERLPTRLHYQRWALRQWNTIHGALNEAAP